MEARINAKNILLVFSAIDDAVLLKDFCGDVIIANEDTLQLPNLKGKSVYICGDLSRANDYNLKSAERVFVIEELSYGDKTSSRCNDRISISFGQVPIFIHGLGVLYRRFFDSSLDHYHFIHAEHTLQSLTESTKAGTALRTGIYLTPVVQEGAELHFRLLRCSTNLSGPTDNFRATDYQIVDALNQEAGYLFENQSPLNHVLAQNYLNNPATATLKQAKARISSHADKTKDMPANGIMAFCTFYNRLDKLKPMQEDSYDLGYKGISGLTKLRFRLKKSAEGVQSEFLPFQFSVTLYPNSVFFMPLSTNRLYTHEIQSSSLSAELLPTRLGYVVRCSKAEAVHVDSDVFLKIDGERVKLEAPTNGGMDELRQLYAEENKSHDFIEYGNKFLFSMNAGDYMKPNYECNNEFRTYNLSLENNVFHQLNETVQFETMGKGRQGAVLMKTDSVKGVPLVRTTSKYASPAQSFSPIHEKLAQQVQKVASLPNIVNNALIEKYTNTYTSMGFHTDQALDLADESNIAVFSCYERPELVTSPRMLIIESKESSRVFQVPMTHNSVIVFSTETNRRFRHKIVLDTSVHTPDNTWLGVTFRTSKTFVQFHDRQAYLRDDTPLRLATDEESAEFYRMRRRENKETDFVYPEVTYTVSGSDLMPLSAIENRV